MGLRGPWPAIVTGWTLALFSDTMLPEGWWRKSESLGQSVTLDTSTFHKSAYSKLYIKQICYYAT